MPFTIGSRTIQFIDLTHATANDYIEVKFESGYKATLVVDPKRSDRLIIDRRRTNPTVLEELYGMFKRDIETQPFGVRYKFARLQRKQDVRANLNFQVQISPINMSFNDSPEVGERLRVAVTHPAIASGTGAIVGSPIKSVELF